MCGEHGFCRAKAAFLLAFKPSKGRCRFFELAPSGQDYFKQSQTRRGFASETEVL